jgi:hypothetical protein
LNARTPRLIRDGYLEGARDAALPDTETHDIFVAAGTQIECEGGQNCRRGLQVVSRVISSETQLSRTAAQVGHYFTAWGAVHFSPSTTKRSDTMRQ